MSVIGFDIFTGDLKKSEVREMLMAPGVEVLQLYPLKKDFHSVDLEGNDKDLKALLKTLQQDVDPEININMILNQKIEKEDLEDLAVTSHMEFETVLACFHDNVTHVRAYYEDSWGEYDDGDEEDLEEEEDLEVANLGELKAAVKKAKDGSMDDLEEWLAVNEVDDAKFRDDYSGRGMFGSKSKIAFTTSADPRYKDGVGALLSKVFAVDSMGHDYIYYTK